MNVHTALLLSAPGIWPKIKSTTCWKVLNGVGVNGVGGISPFSSFLCFSWFLFAFRPGKNKQLSSRLVKASDFVVARVLKVG